MIGCSGSDFGRGVLLVRIWAEDFADFLGFQKKIVVRILMKKSNWLLWEFFRKSHLIPGRSIWFRIFRICICICCDHICICAYEEPVLPVARLFRVVERWGESHHTPRGINVSVFVFYFSPYLYFLDIFVIAPITGLILVNCILILFLFLLPFLNYNEVGIGFLLFKWHGQIWDIS